MKGKIALIVDDQPGIRAMLREFMSGFDIICHETGDGSQALHMLNLVLPDIVLLDVKMPGISGIETLREMRRRGLMMPVIILTAYQDADLNATGDAMAPVFRLNKPFDLEDLTILLRRSLRDEDSPPPD